MTSKFCSEDLSLLRAVNMSGAVTSVEVLQHFPGLTDVEKRLERLHARFCVYGTHVPGKHTIFQITAKGRKLIAERVTAWRGDVVGPAYKADLRGSVYLGEKPVAMRPGAMDAFALGSRRGDVVVPHRLPMTLSAAGDAVTVEDDE